MSAIAQPKVNVPAGSKKSSNKNFVQKKPDQHSISHLIDELARAIEATLPFLAEADRLTERRSIFAIYIDSVKELDQRRKEAMQLVEAMKESGVDPASLSELPAEAQQAVARTLQRHFAFTVDPPENLASADLAALPVDELRERLRAALKRAGRKLASQLVEGFGGLVDRQAVGLVHWPSQNAVRYEFFRRRFYCTDYRKPTAGKPVRRWVDDSVHGQQKIVTTFAESSNLVCVLEHHQHDAIDAFQTAIENSNVVMTCEAEKLLKSVPVWMRPSIRIVDGYLIGEAVRQSETQEEKLLRTTEVVEMIYGLEPAIVLGPYVLAGWGPREIDSVLRERKMQAGAKADRLQRVYWGSCAVGAQLLSTMFLIGSADREMLLTVALLLFLTGVFCMARALRTYLRSVGRSASETMFQVLLLGPVLCAASWQAFFLPLGTASILTGVVLGLLGALLVFMQRRILLSSL